MLNEPERLAAPSTAAPQGTWNLRAARKNPIDRAKFKIGPATADLGESRAAVGVIELTNGTKVQFVLNADSGWGNDSTNEIIHDVELKPQDIKAIGVHTTFGGGIGGDNWNMNRLVVSTRMNGKWTTIFTATGAPLVRFTGNTHDFGPRLASAGGAATLTTCTPEQSLLALDSPVARGSVTIRTGGDNLRGGNDNAFGIVTLQDGRTHEFPLNKGIQWPEHTTVIVTTTVPGGTRVRDLK